MSNDGGPDSRTVDKYFQTGADTCDRRLSRAARKLVHRHLLRILEAEDSNVSYDFLDQNDVWGLLEHWLHGSGQNRYECPLIPSLDIYRVDEEHSLEVEAPSKMHGAYPTFVSQQRPKSSRPRTWFQCAYCGKTFISRFYLDIHLHNTHRLEETSTFCPASDWCRAVGFANCHKVALEDEPYYDRGSDGWGDDGKLIRHKWMKKAHAVSCSVEEIRADCHSILGACGITEASKGWCNSLTCPHHNLGDMLSPDQWQDVWASEMQHSGGFLLVIVCLVLYFFAYFLMNDKESQTGQQSIQREPPSGSIQSLEKSRMANKHTLYGTAVRKQNKDDRPKYD
jgi:hypothetical protein